MNSEIVISLKDILLFVLWGLLVVIFTYLILILTKAFKIIKNVNHVVEDNRPKIDATLEVIPDLTRNIEVISGEFAHDVSAFRGTVDNVAESTESITETLKENQSFMDGIASFMHTVAIGKALYDKFFGDKLDDIKDVIKETEKELDNL
ncbi:hypothetical protein [Fusibacter sp. 3D3]|uniref:hypothetical protein n=1 Tax=Fusibacter sp. 3D3 TaxID=1048380 RepID=UPI0008537BA1|nr:hypothetical protein [Fusibacter sp. 3D3]GAU76882.1 hypothetical protein F3D3_1480 [Fusibacter sp. 3D3]